MQPTSAFGLPVARTEIAEFSGSRALVVERFDRLWTRDSRLLRLPQEDCCQALSVPPNRKYEPDGGPGMRQILELLKASESRKPTRGRLSKPRLCSGYWAPRTGTPRISVFSCCQAAGSG
jgi:serine/threonine-protein kinase HipA